MTLLLFGCGSTRTAPQPTSAKAVSTDYTREKDIVFTPAGWPEELKADLYIPDGSQPRPAVLLIYGGGWKAKDNRSQMKSIAEKLARRGYFVMNTSYRGAPGYRYPAQIDDLREAQRWLLANATRYHIQIDRIAAYGYSAGGHLAALIGTLDAPAELRVKAVVAGGAPTDLRLYPGGKLVPDLLGGFQNDVPEKFREASPVTHVTKDDPPFFLYHGTKDELVPPEHARVMKDALDRAGVSNEIYWIEGRGHIGAFIFEGGSEARAINFLDSVLR
ncbi:prolyl oligopeptidase family serine peptidase [Oleiharenicola lentus]|uniref:prolyl oligopeptidase family serine peptidase n=1 Tax=Oleiharenicola lentus TaxID=2508720 RepID=UPI003F67D243